MTAGVALTILAATIDLLFIVAWTQHAIWRRLDSLDALLSAALVQQSKDHTRLDCLTQDVDDLWAVTPFPTHRTNRKDQTND